MRTPLLLASLSFALGFFASSCGAPTPACSAATCAGCCSADGVCLDGTADSACGTAGLNCDVCSGGQVCAEKRCVMPPPVDPPDAGNPIVAPVETWTWQDFPESACGNGVPTGVAVNVSTRTKDLFIYLQGGGACWNGLTCAFAASNIDTGYTSASFAGDGTKNAAPFSRTNAANPLKDMSFVYVPYCTGDVHAGDAVQTYAVPNQASRTVHHKGGKNMQVFLGRLKDTFPDAQRVFLSGSSAGAFGAQLNYERVAAAWPQAEVHVLADCGQMITPNGTLLSEWLSMWNFTIPTDCTDCTTDFTKFPAYLAQKYPNRRFGLLAYTQDNVLRQFFGFDPATFQQKTEALLASAYDGRSNAKYFLVAAADHVMLDNLLTLSGPGNVPLATWTSQWLSGDAAWANVKP